MVIIAEHKNKIVGLSHSTVVPIHYIDKVQQFTLSSDLAVHPDHRRKGLRNQSLVEKFYKKQLEEIKPHEVVLTYGDIDSVPNTFR